ncbi:MAG: VWA domain-containing protein [Gammaproteobacteria bacterium]|nr:VWA domain-containing protein [Gammaproteobacteria bacterium]
MNLFLYIQNIAWREPLWLLLALQPVFIVFIRTLIQRNNNSLYADKKLQPWIVLPGNHIFTKKGLSKNIAYLLAWLFFSIALAGPRLAISHIDKNQLTGVNIMLVVDLSESMQARDITPNRLRRSKLEIYELLEKAHAHRIGITVFSARPHLFVPITSDHAALKIYLESLELLTFPTSGSQPFEALLFAKKELSKIKGKSVIVLITDGDFALFTDEQLITLNNQATPIFVLGMGTPEGEAIQSKNGKWLQYNQQHVVSRMNEEHLRKLANAFNGKYSPVYDDNSDWSTLFDQGITKYNSVTNITGEKQILWNELFPFFLITSVFLFIFSLNTFKIKKKNIVTFFLLSIFIFSYPENDVYALELGQTDEQAAHRAYQKERYTEAENLYRNINGYNSYLGQANSLYKLGYYHKAIPQFTFALLSAKNDSQRAITLYNLANSYFRTGDFTSAITTYNDVLRYKPKDKSSLHNLKISKILKANIELRLKQREQSISSLRQGQGPRSATIANGVEINENTSVSLGEGSIGLQQDIPLPKLPNLDEGSIKKLLLSGINNIELANQGILQNTQSSYRKNNNVSLLQAHQHLNTIEDAQHLLWKRLFEIEEGFPAPVEKAKTIPGVKPW